MMPARPNTIRLVLGATLAIALVAATRVSPRPLDQDTRPPVWLKGNTHTHTIESDGDSTPDESCAWYREHGYQFLVLTDHNLLTSSTA